MKNIPRRVHFYWGGKVLPYLRYLTLYSFKRYNPEWEVILFVPDKLNEKQTWGTYENKERVDTKDYFDRVEDIGIRIKTFDPVKEAAFPDNLPEVIKSDILRLYLLSTIGGLWSDMDIVYFRPITHVLKETNHIAYFCYRRGGPTQENTLKNGPKYHSIGFLMAMSNNPYFKRLLEGARKVLNINEYQTIGSPYYGTVINDSNISNSDIFNLNIDMVYPSRALPGMWEGPTQYYVNHIHQGVIGWHWYGGHPISGRYQNLITEETYNRYDNIICWLIGKVLRKESV